MSLGYCVKENKPCVQWVQKYFKDCLCSTRDDISFAFGLASLVCWAVAEVPQIVTNFHTKSSHGVSLAFLLTWIVGDMFNLVGCLLEPATLPTQFYTALYRKYFCTFKLYTATTILLVLQTIYYDHIRRWKKRQQIQDDQKAKDEETPLRDNSGHTGIPIPRASPKESPRRDYYYTSARSFSGGGTPTFLRAAKSGPSTMGVDSGSSSEDESIETPTRRSTSRPMPVPRSAGYGTFLATSLSLPHQSRALAEVYVGFTGRRLLQESGGESVIGQGLGWLMAVIYMGGRVPQILLNIKRGSVEGLNPLMFIFALIANATYVGSILVRSTEWIKIKANMPWLLDAIVCVALDLFIILQYIYYRYFRKSRSSGEGYYGNIMEADKAVAS